MKKENPDAFQNRNEVTNQPALRINEKYFEAPDGTLVVGDKSKSQIWYPVDKTPGSPGGYWINEKRLPPIENTGLLNETLEQRDARVNADNAREAEKAREIKDN